MHATRACGDQRQRAEGTSLPSTTWVLGIELGLSGSVARAFPCLAVSPAPTLGTLEGTVCTADSQEVKTDFGNPRFHWLSGLKCRVMKIISLSSILIFCPFCYFSFLLFSLLPSFLPFFFPSFFLSPGGNPYGF